MNGEPVSKELVLLDRARQSLFKAKTVDEVTVIRDKAEAVRSYAKAAKLGLEMQNRAAEIKLRAERKAGEMLATMHLRGGDRRSKSQRSTLNLEELGVSRDESYRWQQEAKVPEKEFEQYLKASGSSGKEVTAAGLLRLAKRYKSSNENEKELLATSSRRKSVKDALESASVVDNEGGLSKIRELCGHLELLESLLEMVVDNCSGKMKKIERSTIIRLLGEMKELAISIESELTRS